MDCCSFGMSLQMPILSIEENKIKISKLLEFQMPHNSKENIVITIKLKFN
jgi:hypothetical protein